MNQNLFTTLLAFATISISAWAIFKYVILLEIRIEPAIFKKIYEASNHSWKLVFAEEVKIENRIPVEYSSILKFNKYPYFYLTHSERLLNAGWHGKDHISKIICFRWNYTGIAKFIRDLVSNKLQISCEVPVYVITPNFVDSIGKIKTSTLQPIQPKPFWKDLEDHVTETLDKPNTKFGFILYGSPGNGKTSFIKYLADKHKLPIYYITFSPEYDNFSIMMLFAQIPPRSMIILEDFDSYFDKRTCIMQNNFAGSTTGARFTFDTILNSLDGVYTSFDRNIFILTANNIEKIDDALKFRPSRFKIVREFKNPTQETIQNFLQPSWAKNAPDVNYDQLIRLTEFQNQKVKFTKALYMLSLPLPKKVYEIAERIHENKVKSHINSNDLENFLQACSEYDNIIEWEKNEA
jgi:hypothetical protein